MMPSVFADFGESVTATAIFASNVHFWEGLDYFNLGAREHPLLHTWSLAIEEQYYLLFPLLLWALFRFTNQTVIYSVLVLGILLSLWLCQWGWQNKPDVNYYFTFSRFWELLLGSLAALYNQHKVPRGGQIPAIAGLLMIMFAMFVFDEQTPHPAWPTLLPTVGTVLVLLYAQSGTAVARWLSQPLVVKLGLISYSLYLWHQPVFAFAHTALPDLRGAVFAAFLVLLSLVLGWISWRYVERPFRISVAGSATQSGPSLWSGRRVLVTSLVAIVGTVGVGQLIATHENMALRYLQANTAQRAILAEMSQTDDWFRQVYLQDTCFFDGPIIADASLCLPANTQLAIWGDSHAAALSFGLREGRGDVGLLSSSGCAPLIDDGQTLSTKCAEANAHYLNLLVQARPKVILLHANWLSKGISVRLLPATLLALQSALPDTRLVIVGGVPQWKPSLPERIVLADIVPSADGMLSSEVDIIAGMDLQMMALVRKANIANIVVLRPQDTLCDGQNCRAFVGPKLEPYAWDYGHLTESGSRDLAVWIRARLLE